MPCIPRQTPDSSKFLAPLSNLFHRFQADANDLADEADDVRGVAHAVGAGFCAAAFAGADLVLVDSPMKGPSGYPAGSPNTARRREAHAGFTRNQKHFQPRRGCRTEAPAIDQSETPSGFRSVARFQIPGCASRTWALIGNAFGVTFPRRGWPAQTPSASRRQYSPFRG